MLVLTPKWKTDRLTKGLFKTNLSHYVSRKTTVVLLLLVTPGMDSGVPVKTKPPK